MSSRQNHNTAHHLPGLDALRALAVALVILYHSDLTGRPQAGFLGVDLFFVLSGFLITGLLMREHAEHGSVNFRGFYLRRARRLLPALFAVLGATVLASLVFAPDALSQVSKDIPAALLYVSNWSQIFGGLTYFESVGRPPLLQHLWSLAIEEQFYLVWPVALLMALKLGGRRLALGLAIAMGIASTAWMTWLSIHHDFPVGNDPTRVYFGTDTHSMGLFVGAAFAALQNGTAAGKPSAWRSGLAIIIAAGALAAILAAAMVVPENSEPLYRGGFLMFCVISALLVWSVIQPGALPGRMAENKFLAWIGQRSYGLYLWHWPVFQLLRPGMDIPYHGISAFSIQITTTIILAEICYRWIETPVRRMAAPARASSGATTSARVMRWIPPVAATAALWAIAILLVRPGVTPQVAEPHTLAALTAADLQTAAPTIESVPQIPVPDAPAALTASTPASNEWTARSERRQASAFGDSVMIGAENKLHKVIGAVDVDAEVGRQAEPLLRRVKARAAAHDLADSIIIHMGTNGFIAERQVRALLDTLRDRQTVVLVNAHAPRRWVVPNNDLLARVVRDYPNVRLVDWSQLSEAHPEYFVADNIHLTGPGLRAYTGAIQAAADFLPPSRFTAAANYAALAASSGFVAPRPVMLAATTSAPASSPPSLELPGVAPLPAPDLPADQTIAAAQSSADSPTDTFTLSNEDPNAAHPPTPEAAPASDPAPVSAEPKIAARL